MCHCERHQGATAKEQEGKGIFATDLREFFKNQSAKIRAKRFAAKGLVSFALNGVLFLLWYYSQ